MKRIAVAALVLATFTGSTGCKGCRDVERTVEVEYSGGYYSAQMYILSGYERQGYDCSNSTAIRNASGATIGRKYTCTKCE